MGAISFVSKKLIAQIKSRATPVILSLPNPTAMPKLLLRDRTYGFDFVSSLAN
ncbi:MAG: hypothetical protein ACHBN1_31225 [Heteroscytonema crispum UTEX LB 1556]